MTELVLLVEPEGATQNGKLRPMWIPLSAKMIVERVHQRDPSQDVQRIWTCREGERAATGQRIFREEVAATTPDPAEAPVFDELTLKSPLPLHGDETPLGFRRKHLRKA